MSAYEKVASILDANDARTFESRTLPVRSWPRSVPSLAALCLYTAASCAIFARHHFFFRNAYFGTRGDPQIYMWFLSWWPYAVTHGLNPFVSHVVWAPDGVDLTWTPSLPGLAFLAWPLTTIVGPIASFNILSIAAPSLGAFAAFLLCKELSHKYFPSLVGGWLFGFSSYEIGQLMGHLPLDFTVCVPAIAWLAVLRGRGKIRGGYFIALSTALLTLQFGTSIEIFATATLFGFIALLLTYALQARDRAQVVRMAIELACAYLLCFIIASPYLYYMLKDGAAVPPLIQPPNIYVADVMNYLVPTRITAVNGAWAASIAKHFTGNDAENGAYLGLPLLMIIGAFAVRCWRERRAQIVFTLFIILVLFSFGPYLHFEGHSICPMPWWLAGKLPLLRQALPVRFSLYTSLLGGVIAAVWLASLSKEQSMLGYMLALLAILALMPNIRGKRAYWFTDLRELHSPKFFSNGDYKRFLEPGDNVVVLPYGHFGYSMLWQVMSGMYFRMAGGYVTAYTPSAFIHWPAVQMFFEGKPGPDAQDEIATFCSAKDVDAVILTGRTRSIWDSTFRELGWKRTAIDGVIIYRVLKNA
jgi:hypothetical protein